ncbi:MAG TPA: fructose-bisphosphate aldolase, partial [Chitinophagales bacterium]|nr:fructose-bisphosphate aldolase [Chitinophagales bacterium]HNA40244.1 fructose-bisphosphate aldolase [Chitinophagales bacterium]HNK12865.1 fructose-bisphosphate aldolase [Chitinophagales bacterium]
MSKYSSLLGEERAKYLLEHQCKTIDKSLLHLPCPDFTEKIWIQSNRSPQVLRSLQQLYGTGRLANTGY